jgi:ribonuclease P protein component
MTDPVTSVRPDETFRRRERILKTGDFRLAYKKGLSVKTGPLVLCCRANGKPNSRLGFSISSRNVKLATSRNRIKRVFREAYRRHKGSILCGFDIVLIVKRDPDKRIAYIDAESLLIKAAKRAGIIL